MEEKLKEIFEKHNLLLVDMNDYQPSNIPDIDKGRIVSYKWLARRLQ